MENNSHHLVASFIDGRLATFDPAQIDSRPPPRAVAVIEQHREDQGGPVNVSQDDRAETLPATIDPVTEIATLLARITRLAQTLNEADRRRSRELVSATLSLLMASTIMKPADQALFQSALRNANNGA